MAGKFLLETNIVVAFFNDEEAVQNALDEADEVWLSAIVMGELMFGARKSGRVEANLRRIEELGTKYGVLDCDAETAHFFGQIKNQLRMAGKPIPENDV